MKIKRTAALTCGLTALASTGLLAAPALANTPTHVVIAMGDSYISGEGGAILSNDYVASSANGAANSGPSMLGTGVYVDSFGNPATPGSDTELCHKSPTADINELAASMGDQAINLACSDATTANILSTQQYSDIGGTQLQQLQAIADNPNYVIDAIVVSIGGNDLKFANVLTDCTQVLLTHDCGSNGEMSKLTALGPTVQQDITNVLNGISSMMANADPSDTSYRLIQQTYPEIFAPSNDRRMATGDLPMYQDSPGAPMSNGSVDWAYTTADPYVDSIVEAGAANASYSNIQVVDMSHALDGHLLSSLETAYNGPDVTPDPTNSEWITAISPDYKEAAPGEGLWQFLGTLGSSQLDQRLQESFHPDVYGQEAFGQCLSLAMQSNDMTVGCQGYANQGPTADTLYSEDSSNS